MPYLDLDSLLCIECSFSTNEITFGNRDSRNAQPRPGSVSGISQPWRGPKPNGHPTPGFDGFSNPVYYALAVLPLIVEKICAFHEVSAS